MSTNNVQTMIFIMTTSKFGNYKAAMRICLWRVQSPYQPPFIAPQGEIDGWEQSLKSPDPHWKRDCWDFVCVCFFFFLGGGGGKKNHMQSNGAYHVIHIISIIFYVSKIQFAPNVITCNALNQPRCTNLCSTGIAYQRI